MLAFDRVARPIQRTIALAHKVTDPVQPRPAARRNERRPSAPTRTNRHRPESIAPYDHLADAAPNERHLNSEQHVDTEQRPLIETVATPHRELVHTGVPYTNNLNFRTLQSAPDSASQSAPATKLNLPGRAPPPPALLKPPVPHSP